MKYKYPCIFTKEKEGGYNACFPDWEKEFGGYTCGDNWPHVIYMANDLLGLMCYYTEKDKNPFPPATAEKDLSGIVRIIEADTEEYGKFFDKKHRHGLRWRLSEKARRRYLYPTMPQTPDEENK